MPIAGALNTLSAGLILLCSFAMVGTRQVQGVVRFFVLQSLLLSASSFLLASGEGSVHLWALGAITVAAKVIVIPWVLKRTLVRALYVRREIEQAVNIPTSLLVSLFLAIAAELLVGPVVAATGDPVIAVNLPIGLACLLIGAYSLMARREAIPQLIGMAGGLVLKSLAACLGFRVTGCPVRFASKDSSGQIPVLSVENRTIDELAKAKVTVETANYSIAFTGRSLQPLPVGDLHHTPIAFNDFLTL